jgi:hypothetical protein
MQQSLTTPTEANLFGGRRSSIQQVVHLYSQVNPTTTTPSHGAWITLALDGDEIAGWSICLSRWHL